MVGNTYAVLWNTTAVNQLKEIHNYIAQDSSKNAANVVESILQSTFKLSVNPEQHPRDKYKLKNDGSYRAYELFTYRIAYRIYKTKIRILRVRSTHREPQNY